MRSKANAHFVLVGTGDEVELVRNSLAQHHLVNITLLPPVTQDEFKKMLAEFDIGLFSLHRGHTTHNFPGKILAYMVQGKPVLGSVNSGNDLQDVIEKAKAGLIAINGDDEDFLNNALKLLDNAVLRKTMGENANKLLSSVFSVQAAATTILTPNAQHVPRRLSSNQV
jgi:glycosyltransferase involved in cell wall biosynthesis